MIRNLEDTTQKNTEQDWLKTNLAKFSRMLQGQKDLLTVGQLILSELAPVVGAHQAEFYVLTPVGSTQKLKLFASYASGGQASHGKGVELGQGLVGQCAIDKSKILLTNVASTAFRVASGLSEGAALDVLVLPVVFEGEVRGVLELASLERFNPAHQAFLDQLTESIGIVINTISANMRTEDLLTQSQSLAEELQSRQQELQQTNEELQEKARLLVHQNQEVERKNQEVEQARQALEEKAEQLALTSKYKSEFLANMSHELRTPLNSLLILSDQLHKNNEGNLSARQVEFAKTIHLSGNDLLAPINDILDLSKIESGTVAVDVSELRLEDLQRSVDRSFRHVAEAKHVGFEIAARQPLPKSIVTDVKRLQQIVKNLLSNAFKFTHQGSVSLVMNLATSGWSIDHTDLNRAAQVLAFSVCPIPASASRPRSSRSSSKRSSRPDGSTSRKYGGTGLGLAISRELARLLGGEIRLSSAPGAGRTFTLYLPQSYTLARSVRPARAEALPAFTRAPAEAEQLFDFDAAPAEPEAPVFASVNVADDDRHNLLVGDKVLLIVENDLAFADVLLQAARRNGFKGLVSSAGALAMTRDHRPAVITLDIFLPDMEGWRLLERLKTDLATRHIPVCVISTDDSRRRALNADAVGFLTKPLQSADEVDRALVELHRFADRASKRLLVMLAPGPLRQSYLEGLPADTDVALADSAAAARAELAAGQVDCLITDGTTAGAPDADRAGQRRRRGRDRLGTRPQRLRIAPRRDAGQHARRDRVLAAPRRGRDVRAATPLGPGAQRFRPRARGPQGADRRRRHAQHLRPGRSAGCARHGHRLGRERARRDPHDRDRPGHRRGADGHHDAGDGRHADHARDAPPAARQGAAADRRHRQGDEGRPREVHRRRRLGLSFKAGRQRQPAGCAARLARSLRWPRPPSPAGRCPPPLRRTPPRPAMKPAAS